MQFHLHIHACRHALCNPTYISMHVGMHYDVPTCHRHARVLLLIYIATCNTTNSYKSTMYRFDVSSHIYGVAKPQIDGVK